MIIFEHINTKVTARPIPTPLDAAVVSARVGQVPSTSLNVGFCLIRPSRAISLAFIYLTPICINVIVVVRRPLKCVVN